MKLIWSLEANKECESVMNSKTFFVSPNGENVRTIKYEVYQTFYDMTREPYTTSRHLGNDVKEQLLAKDPKEFTFSFLRSLFGDTAKKEESGKVRIKKSRYEVTDIIHLEAGEYHNASACDTTIGRICWNKIMIDRVGLRRYFPYMNDVLIKKRSTKYESDVTQLLNDDKIDTTTFRNYIDHRDWLGLTLHGLITVSFTEKTIKTPASVKKLRDELFKKYEKELAAGDIVVAGKIEKELVNKMVEIIKDDPGFDLYNSGARGDINNHLKNLFIMRGGVLNPNTGKYDIMKTSFNEGLRKEDFTAASNSVVQGAYPKSCATASTGYLAKQLMAGLQTEVIGPPGSDCGTKFTLEYDFEESDINDFNNRYIDMNGSKVLLTRETAKKYVGKTIHLYSPFGCIGVGKNNECLCEKCAGIQNSKYVGLNSNKVATVLTNLNMKKFHDSTLRFKKITPDSILLNPDHNDNGLFTDDGSNIKVDTAYMEVYVPSSYFENSFMAENLGGMINLFGIVPIGIFKNGKFDHFDTMNIPSWHKYFTYDEEIKNVELPGLGKTQCHVYKYIKGQKFCINELLEDASNAQLMLRFATYGKIPGTVPYGKALNIWRKNKKMNNVNFGVPSVIEEVILSTAYRWKKNPAYKFAKIIGKHPDMNLYDYEMASIRRICQVTSTFTGITFESFDDMVSTAINRSRTGGIETESPLEELFKL